MDTPVNCSKCGHEWARDPLLEVPCPTCRAPVGHVCKHTSPSGHRKSGLFSQGALPKYGHPDRDLAAATAGKYEHSCTAPRRFGKQLGLFGPDEELAPRSNSDAQLSLLG